MHLHQMKCEQGMNDGKKLRYNHKKFKHNRYFMHKKRKDILDKVLTLKSINISDYSALKVNSSLCFVIESYTYRIK